MDSLGEGRRQGGYYIFVQFKAYRGTLLVRCSKGGAVGLELAGGHTELEA